MPKLLFVDRHDNDGRRIFHFLQFSIDRSDFVVTTYHRRGEDVQEETRSVPDFLSSANEADQNSFAEAVGIVLGAEILPSLKIVSESE